MLFKLVADTIKQKTKWVFTTALFLIILIHIDFFIINPCFLYFQAPINYAATAKAEEYSRSKGYGISGKSFLVPSINYKMIYIPPGSFIMGSPQSEKGRDNDETQHKVTLTKGFYIGVTEVTQGQWQTIMGKNPSTFKDCGDDCPVENVSWDDCQAFIKKLNQMGEVNEYIYRLPTEAEWEYACRAGSTTAFAGGDIVIQKTECILWPRNYRMPGGACTTCMAMCGNGARIGMASILQVKSQTHKGLHLDRTGCLVAAAGITALRIVVRPTVMAGRHRKGRIEDKNIMIHLGKEGTQSGDDLPLDKYFTNSMGMKFAYIPPGTFMMGSPLSEKERDNDEKQHEVTLTKGFYLGTTEVICDDCPVESISWDDCQEFIRRLNQKEKTKKYRLPTEAEWEYACRAKGKKAFANGGISETGCGNEPNLDKMGWYCGNSDKRPHPVAKKKPNTWGVYDMHGNVWEWCQDKCKWEDKIITDTYRGAVVDPLCNIGPSRVNRGGGWGSGARGCRSANRRSNRPDFRVNDLCFRLARTP